MQRDQTTLFDLEAKCLMCGAVGRRRGARYQCPDASCGLEWEVRVRTAKPEAEKTKSPVTLRQARRLLGRETAARILQHGRHHHDEQGLPYWLPDELVEADELVDIEQRRMAGEGD